jgi:hypothetical protein
MAPGFRNLRSAIDDGHAVNEEELPLVPLQASHDNKDKHTRVSSHAGDTDDAQDGQDGWELDDFDSNASRDNLPEAADYDLATASRPGSGRRVKLPDEEKDGDARDDDPAMAMVKAVVLETDDPSLPNLTFRVLVLGSILCIVGAAISQLFFVGLLLAIQTRLPHKC